LLWLFVTNPEILTIKIPTDPVLIGELQGFESTVMPASALTRYAALLV
jgi:hypothetical protein